MNTATENSLQDVWTAVPGTVESYDATKQRANVRLGVKTVTVGEDGDVDTDEVAVLNSVPVVHPGGGGFRAVFPVQRGDTVLVVFCSRAIDRWLTNGGVVDPQTSRHHDPSDAVAITGLRDFGHVLSNAPSDHMSIGADTGATIEIFQNEVRVGGSTGVQPTVKLSSFMTAFNTLIGAIATAVGSVPGGATAGSAITTALSTFDTSASTFTTAIAKVL